MFCRLPAVLVLGPLGRWAMARKKAAAVPDCCTGNHRRMAVTGAIAISVLGLCLGGFLLSQTGPVDFRNICSVWTRP